MCGIFAVFGMTGDQAANRRKVVELCKRIRHRGPDWESTWTDGNGNFLAHQRLAIVCPGESGNQPLFMDTATDQKNAWVVNGEIYNHEALRKEHNLDEYGVDCDSDSAVRGSVTALGFHARVYLHQHTVELLLIGWKLLFDNCAIHTRISSGSPMRG
eukprot:8239149-Pyramimonas_sp.AAC.1